MGLKIDAVVCPMRPKKVSPSRTHSVILSKTGRINNKKSCLVEESFILLTFGDANLGKSSGEWNIWNEAEFALPKGYSGGAHQEGSCESGNLSFPSYYIFLTFEIKTLLVRGCLWWHTALVYHALWLQLLCPPSPRQWQAAWTSKKPGDCFVP